MESTESPSLDLGSAGATPQALPQPVYKLDRVYTNGVHLTVEERTPELPKVPGPLVFGWDWTTLLGRPRMFDVAVTVGFDGSWERLESVRVTVNGRFTIEEGTPSIKFSNFVRVHAPAMLMPYARELLSSVTRHGFYGAYHIPLVNILELMKDKTIEGATGTRLVRENHEKAAGFVFADEVRAPEAIVSPQTEAESRSGAAVAATPPPIRSARKKSTRRR
jgi:preprotein translocase subunit SecB